MGKHFLTKCTDGNRVENIEVQLIEQMQECNYDLKGKLWCTEKYWINCKNEFYGKMNCRWDWYIVLVEKAVE